MEVLNLCKSICDEILEVEPTFFTMRYTTAIICFSINSGNTNMKNKTFNELKQNSVNTIDDKISDEQLNNINTVTNFKNQYQQNIIIDIIVNINCGEIDCKFYFNRSLEFSTSHYKIIFFWVNYKFYTINYKYYSKWKIK